MKICILSRDSKLYSTSRLVEAARARGHQVQVIDALKCYMNINSTKLEVRYKHDTLGPYDAIIPRIGAGVTFFGTAVLRQFENMGTYSVNPAISISRSRDKLRALQLLTRKGIAMPITGFAHSTENTDGVIKIVGGAPLVIKLLEGTQGRGVVLAETGQAAESVVDAFRDLDANILIQEFIKESSGTDIRAFVVGDRVVAAMQRRSKNGEFRANLHRGGTGEQIKLTAEERAVAKRAAKALGLNVAGVDIIRSNKGPLVLEVNSSPGLQGIESTTGIDISGLIIEYIEKNARPIKQAQG